MERDKDLRLMEMEDRNHVGLLEIYHAITQGKILAKINNPNTNFPHQKMLIIDINNYAYCVPFVESETEIFLKTAYPSHKFTALYLGNTIITKSQGKQLPYDLVSAVKLKK